MPMSPHDRQRAYQRGVARVGPAEDTCDDSTPSPARQGVSSQVVSGRGSTCTCPGRKPFEVPVGYRWCPPLSAHSGTAMARHGGLTAPESVSRRCAQLQGSVADLVLGPRLVRGALAFWMQTTGTALLADKPCSPARVRLVVQGGRSACRLLYSAAVQRSSHLGRDHLIRRLCHADPLPAHSAADLPKLYSLVRSRRRC